MSKLYTALLTPLGTDRFQPTGFKDVGAATYRSPSGVDKLLVESEQSIANRLENVCWDVTTDDVVEDLQGMPYVKVMEDGKYLTSSITEAHRIGSVYVVRTDFFADKFYLELDYGNSGSKNFHKMLFKYDPNSLIHGLFLPKIAGDLRVTRALSGFVEAEGVSEVVSGGVKVDHVDASTTDEKGSDSGYGNVPYSRSDFVAQTIKAVFKVDTGLIRSFRLGPEDTHFLETLCKYKIRAFLDHGLRFRSRCELVVSEGPADLPDLETLRKEIRSAIGQVKSFAPVSVANYNVELQDDYSKSREKKEAAKKKADEKKEAKTKKKESK